MNKKVRVLIVEDSVVQRKILRMALDKAPGIEVVGHASNGKLALSRLAIGDVDVMTLDLEMPVMGGLEVLKNLEHRKPLVGAIVVSALSQQGAAATLEAMRLGAFDLITKPSAKSSLDEVIAGLEKELVPRIMACAEFVQTQRSGRRAPAAPLPRTGNARPGMRQSAPLGSRPGLAPRTPAAALPSAGAPGAAQPRKQMVGPPRLIVIGSSTGGPQALDTVLSRLPGDLSLPVLIVQHMPPMFTKTLAESLDRKCALKVMEAEDGQEVRAGEILIAPGGRQMKVVRAGTGLRVKLTDDPPERSCRPSVDYLFRSASQVTRGNTVAAVLTGMGDDGTAGCRLLQPLGAHIIAQDQATCVVFGMPKLLVTEGLANVVLPLEEVAAEIAASSRRGARA